MPLNTIDQAERLPSAGRLRLTLALFTISLVGALTGLTMFAADRIFERLTPGIRTDLLRKSAATARDLAAAVDVAILGDDRARIEALLTQAAEDMDAVGFQVLGAKGDLRGQLGRALPAHERSRLLRQAPDEARVLGAHVVAWSPVAIEGLRLGQVIAVFSTERLREGDRMRQSVLQLAAIGGIAAVLMTLLFIRYHVSPIIQLTRQSLQGLSELNATLEARVAERTRAQLETNEQLRRSLHELETTQAQLLEASRLAGMADVASSVLHNVGNAMNSVTVSCALVRRRLEELGPTRLRRLALMLRSSPAFAPLRAAKKGAALIDYVEEMGVAVEGAVAAVAAELDTMDGGLGHVREIIRAQQDTARRGPALPVRVSPRGLVEEALSLSGVQTTVPCEVIDESGLADIWVDRHKVLQVLTNLLQNARDATVSKDGATAPAKISIRLRMPAEGRVCISVEDHGCGIPPDVLPKIFSHGFTTKADGHGFGLHASACQAVELGGRLWAQSEGTGEGSRFHLELPVDARPFDGGGEALSV